MPIDAPGLELITDPSISAEPIPPWPKRGRSLQIVAEDVVRSVKTWVKNLIEDQDRGEWYRRKLDRMAKYRGWLSEKRSPWPGCSNVHFPMLQTAELRQNAGLHNVIMTMRPVVSAKATRPANMEKQDHITELLDTQLFVDPGPERAERVWSDYVSQFGQTGNAVLYCPWVREEQDITEVFYRPRVPTGQDPDEYLRDLFRKMFKSTDEGVTPDPQMVNRFRVLYPDPAHAGETAEALVDVFLAEDQTVELVVKRRACLYDGPVALPVDVDDLFVPTRCENLQPPSGWNPRGAPRVVLRDYLSVDAIRRNRDSGDFNWLTDADMKAVERAALEKTGLATPAPEDGEPIKTQTDAMEGRDHRQPTEGADAADAPALGQITLPIYRVFDGWDVDGDDLLEEMYWVVIPDADVLAEARLLRERWPSTRAYRPLAEAVCIPVPGRWYGMGLLELGEALQDLVKATFDMSFDASTIAKRPFFFYNANAWKGSFDIGLGPGDGYPVTGDPRAAILFPAIPAGDQQWAFQTIGLAIQAFERLLMLGDLQLGRVPQGKASALRTYGTTAALLQQGDVRADQMLLRLFGGIRGVARIFHSLNRHLLPPGKELRRLGWDGDDAQGYLTYPKGPEDVDADVEFDFRPDFLQSSPEALSQALESFTALIATPMAFSLGIADPIKFYTLLKDIARAKKLDHRKYLKPPTPDGGTPIFAHEVVDAILSDRLPDGVVPAEGTAAHAKVLFAFITSEQFGLLTPAQVGLFKAYLAQLGARFQREQLAQQAQLFQQSTGQMAGGAGQGGIPVGNPPEMGTGAEATGQMMTQALGPGQNGGAA